MLDSSDAKEDNHESLGDINVNIHSDSKDDSASIRSGSRSVNEDDGNPIMIDDSASPRSEENISLYTAPMVSQRVFKTSNRILEDIRFNLHFLLNKDDPISLLNSKTINYAHRLAGWNGIPPYSIQCISKDVDYCPYYQKFDAPSYVIHRLRCLLVDHDNNPKMISKNKIYHLNIKIKTNFKSHLDKYPDPKLAFFLIEKKELFERDVKDLYSIDSTEDSSEDSSLDEQQMRALKQSIPKIIDSATYLSFDTQTLLRVEIIESAFGKDDLELFELDAIKSLNADSGNIKLSKSTPTQSDCFHHLFKILKKPIIDDTTKSQGGLLSASKVSSHISTEFLIEKLCFQEISKKELKPVNYRDFRNGDGRKLIKDWYLRMITEAIYYGTLTSTGGKSPFKDLGFKPHISIFYKILNEEYSQESITYEVGYDSSKSQLSFKSDDFIILSIFSFYSVGTIIRNYKILSQTDGPNDPIYFQSITNVSRLLTHNYSASEELQTFLATEVSNGVLTFDEIQKYFDCLGIRHHEELSKYNLLQFYKSLEDNTIIEAYKLSSIGKTSSHGELSSALKHIQIFKKSSQILNFMRTELISLNEAYRILEISDQVDDDTVLIAYNFKKDETYNEESFGLLNKALVSIATYRRSHTLLNFSEENLPMFFEALMPTDESEDSIYKFLNLEKYASDFQVLTIMDQYFAGENEAIKQNLLGYEIDDPHNFTNLDNFKRIRIYLRLLNHYRDSRLIRLYLEKGRIPPDAIPLDHWPAGLNNIGNTCYLNSLLQFYFVIKPLRDQVLEFHKSYPSSYNAEIANNATFKNRRIGGRELSLKEVERSYQLTYQLRNLFNDMIYAKTRDIIPTKELAYLAFSPMIQEVEFESKILPEIDNNDDGGNNNSDNDKDDNITELYNNATTTDNDNSEDLLDLLDKDDNDDDIVIMNKAKTSEDKVLSSIETASLSSQSDDTSFIENVKEKNAADHIETDKSCHSNDHNSAAVAKISFDQLVNTLEIGRQQDVTECIENVLFQLEASLDPINLSSDGEQYDLIKKMFYGKTKQILTPCKNPDNKRLKTERFLNLFVNVNDKPKDIYDALDDSFKEDDMTLEGNEQVKRSIVITELPDVLHIQIQRVQYDIARGMAVKSIQPLPLHETIYLDRYMENNTLGFLSKKQEHAKNREELKSLKKQLESMTSKGTNGLTVLEALVTTKKFLESDNMNKIGFAVKPTTIITLEKQIEEFKKKKEFIQSRISELDAKIDSHFDIPEYQKLGYELFALFIHRGEASYGHYWVYIKDPVRNIYRKYNDETVTEVKLEEVLNFSEGNTATPYFVVYAKKNFFTEGIEPLKRIID
ncbi:ubiquitin-specific protease [Saccharomycopsis crataegensis]|uniref:ubiquitinyl hydrolase 1 n=1 Tax=Saccharomycopsis crataegensis TaxID=43959 RepID=A0AAV5QFT1_9ASCO|nr:ubiquitin-specific protease [Saccharomycopsis crataegensis]